jgi:hypothetical protein
MDTASSANTGEADLSVERAEDQPPAPVAATASRNASIPNEFVDERSIGSMPSSSARIADASGCWCRARPRWSRARSARRTPSRPWPASGHRARLELVPLIVDQHQRRPRWSRRPGPRSSLPALAVPTAVGLAAGIDRAVPAPRIAAGRAMSVVPARDRPSVVPARGFAGREALLELGPPVLEAADQYEPLAEAVRRLARPSPRCGAPGSVRAIMPGHPGEGWSDLRDQRC